MNPVEPKVRDPDAPFTPQEMWKLREILFTLVDYHAYRAREPDPELGVDQEAHARMCMDAQLLRQKVEARMRAFSSAHKATGLPVPFRTTFVLPGAEVFILDEEGKEAAVAENLQELDRQAREEDKVRRKRAKLKLVKSR